MQDVRHVMILKRKIRIHDTLSHDVFQVNDIPIQSLNEKTQVRSIEALDRYRVSSNWDIDEDEELTRNTELKY